MTTQYLMAIDQGTTSSRAIIFDNKGVLVATASQEFEQLFPQHAWVEHRPENIWQTTLASCRQALAKSKLSASAIEAIGITNQRETTLVWDKQTGEPIYNAIVWQDRRTAERCQQLKNTEGLVEKIQQKTGLLIDPYFSASKIEWLLDNVPDAREKAQAGQLCFGTVDSFLLWQLTQGAVFATDASNASRTLLFNIVENDWDDELLALFNIPRAMLPQVKDSADDFGVAASCHFGEEIVISAVLGDQQAALVGQACFTPGMFKSTFGTGCFMMANIGQQIRYSQHQLLTTVAYRLDGQIHYALEGSIFMAGATMQWLRDGLKLFANVTETEALAKQVRPDSQVYMVPAFTGLGAPHWQPDARGAIVGLTRDSGINELVAAAIASVAYQCKDLIQAIAKDGIDITTLRVDGGMASNEWLMQFLADMLAVSVERPKITETTALGVALLAGLQQGLFAELSAAAQSWQLDKNFYGQMSEAKRKQLYTGWQQALQKVIT